MEIEFIIKSSQKLIYNYISTDDGLSKWFADKVSIVGDKIIFEWGKEKQEAKILYSKFPKVFKFAWLEDINSNNKYYVEFNLTYAENIEACVLKITDFIEPGEEEDNELLWEENVNKLKKVLGVLNL
ncbi:MAG: START-like domain-containing protein [Bacteroidales bacterium]|nr:START-like domain-containing protein [Bacteroidales bacterium]